VVFATEKMDDERWQLLESGELVHVGADLSISRRVVLPRPPAYRLTREDLSPEVASAQHPLK
jgi:glutamine amidotransferase